MERKEQELSVSALEEGVVLETGFEHHLTEREASGQLVFVLVDEGGEPHADQACELSAPGGFSASVTTDQDGRYEHPEPVSFGDYDLQTGNARRTLSAVREGGEPPRLVFALDELEDPPALESSPPPEEAEPEPLTPFVEIVGPSGAPPRHLTKDLELELRAAVLPAGLAGSYAWEAEPAEKVELSPGGARCVAKGLQLSRGDEDLVTLRCTFTPDPPDDPAQPSYEEEPGELALPVRRPGVIHFALVHPMGYRLAGVELSWERDGRSCADPLLPTELTDDPEVFVEAVVWGRYRVQARFPSGAGRRGLAWAEVPLLAARAEEPHLVPLRYL